MIATGLCSVTLRALPALRVLDLAAAAGLARIEWGGDVHAPPGDAHTARDLRAAGLDRGVAVASYGSYFRPGPHRCADAAAVLATAAALGAPRVRIWAGDVGSAAATAEQRRTVVAQTRAAAARAADAGIRLAFEFHAGTLTDDPGSALRLLADVDHPAVGTYWQPPEGAADDAAVDGLHAVLPWVDAVHVFSWWPGNVRLPLAAREPLWRRAFDVLGGTGRDIDALLEFVTDDDPGAVARDATTLAGLLHG